MGNRDITNEAIVEFLGTFALIFFGVGAIILTQGGNIVAIALAHGLAIGLMIMAVGHISGGHFNPAVSIAMVATGRMEVFRAGVYIVAQIVGGVAAAGALTLVFPDLGNFGRNNIGINNGVPMVGDGMSVGNALVMEIILTFFLMFVIFGMAVDWRSPKAIAGLVIGLTITLDILAGGVVSGALMNPARFLGPAIVQQDFTNFWIWIVGPIVGALIAAFLYQGVLLKGVREEPPTMRIAAPPTPVAPPPPPPTPRRRSSRR